MDTRKKMGEQMCLSSLSVQRSEYDNAHHFETKRRKIHNSFGFILKGSVEFSCVAEKVTAKEGDVIFIPEGVRYLSHWVGSPQIVFISVHFLMKNELASIWRTMPLQRIKGEQAAQIGEMICSLYESAGESDREQLLTYAKFYEIAGRAISVLQQDAGSGLPAPLQSAIAYIENNYRTITSVQQIAQACYISESRLFHLFQEHLKSTPISFLNKLRIQTAMELLKTTDNSIQEIAEQLNFHSEYYFRKTFQKTTGVLPSAFRRML